MKPDSFDKDLKRIAGDFDLPVRNDLFEEVMNTRKKKRRLVIAFYFIAATIVASGAFSLYINRDHKQTPGKQQAAVYTESSQENNTGSVKVIRGQKEVVPEKPGQSVDEPKESPGPMEPVAAKEENRNKTFSSPVVFSKANKPRHRSSAHVNDQQRPVLHSVSLPKEQKINAEELPPRLVTSAFENEMKQPGPENNNPEIKTVPIADSVMLATSDSASIPPVADATPKQKAERIKRLEAGIYSDYFAITNAINSTSLIPLNKPDSFGLSDKANYAFSVGIKGIYRLNSTWGISLGVGINTLRFDKIRIAEVKVDSLTAYELTNSGNLKGLRAFNQNQTEQSFTWLEIPLGMIYTFPINRKMNFCTEAGMVYQTLVQNKVYEFTTSSQGDLQYSEKTNTGHERVNKNVFALFVQPGISTNLGKRLSLFTGLSYRYQPSSYYKTDYFKTGSLYFIGASCNFTYKF